MALVTSRTSSQSDLNMDPSDWETDLCNAFSEKCHLDSPEEAADRKIISEEMSREGIFHNQQHFSNELACRMAQKQHQRQKDAKCHVKIWLYRALLDKQIELLELPSSSTNLSKYEKIVDALGALKIMQHNDWSRLDKQDILQQLIGHDVIPVQRTYCPLSLDE